MTWHIHLPRGVDKSHTGDQKRDSYAANFLHLRMQQTFAFCSELLHDGIESKVNAEDGEENKIRIFRTKLRTSGRAASGEGKEKKK